MQQQLKFLIAILIAGTSLVSSSIAQEFPKNNQALPEELDSEEKDGGFESKSSSVKDIVERLHALDADIGKLIYNSSSLHDPSPQVEHFQGGKRFTEVLTDLDSLQDEIGGLVQNATRTRQYNILVRLRPLNTLLYRIRHNLQLMRNSLVAISTVANLERIGNNVLDSTLSVLMRPDAPLADELGDSGNYDIDLDRLDDVKPLTNVTDSSTTTYTTTTNPPPTTPSSTTTTTTTTGKPSTPTTTIARATRTSTPSTTSAKPVTQPETRVAIESSSASPETSSSITILMASNTASSATNTTTTKRPNSRRTRRPNSRNSSRRSTSSRPTSTSNVPADVLLGR